MRNLIFVNGNIYTLEKDNPKVSALAIWNRKILAVGDDFFIKKLKNRNSEIIDLKGKTVIPAFCDCHTHFLNFALDFESVDLTKVKTYPEGLNKIREKIKKLKPGEWVLGKGWDKNIWGVMPQKDDLDKISPKNPVALYSKDQHFYWVNSLTLDLAKIDKNSPDPFGGKIDKDNLTGEPTGILKENACDLIKPFFPEETFENLQRFFKKAVKIAYSYGVTSIHNFEGEKRFRFLQKLQQKEKLPLRILESIPKEKIQEAIDLGICTGFGDEYFRVGGIKLYADGTLGLQTALLFKPYENSDNFGMEVTSQEELNFWVKKANENNLSVAVHSIGDKAVNQVLNAIENVKTKNSFLRNRIEHCQLVQENDFKRFKEFGVIASVQPIHCPADIKNAEKYWGKRCKNAYAYKTFLQNKVNLCFGSDVPIEGLNPLQGIYAAVQRKNPEDEKSWYPKQKLSIKQAIEGFTKGAAFASYEEKIKGTLKVGKLADFVILSEDIFKIKPENILDCKVLATAFDGEVVFGEGNL
jgi:predicted amidohydrolase YtcJ